MTDGGQSLNRDLKLDGGVPFFPQDPSSCSGLGFDHSVYSYYGKRGGGPRQGGCGGSPATGFYKTYVKQKPQLFEPAYAAMSLQSFKEGSVRDPVAGGWINNP